MRLGSALLFFASCTQAVTVDVATKSDAVTISDIDFAGGTPSPEVTTTEVAGTVRLAKRAIWWDDAWHFRLPFSVDTGGIARTDAPVELVFNTATLSPTPIDPASVRVVETDLAGNPIAFPESRFDLSGNTGYLVFLFSGNTQRRYAMYFDTLANGPKSPLPSDVSVSSPTQSNGVVNWQSLGLDYQFLPDGLGFGSVTASGLDLGFSRQVKILSSGGSYATQTPVNGYSVNIADNVMTSYVGPTRLKTDGTLLVHKIGASAGTLRLTQYTVQTTGAGTRMTIVIENAGGAHVDNVRLFDGGDFDIGGGDAGDDTAVVLGDGTATTREVGLGHIGFRATVPSASHMVADRLDIFAAMAANLLTNATAFGPPGDAGMAHEWMLGTIAPGGNAYIHEAWGVSLVSQADLSATILPLATPLPIAQSPREGRLASPGTFESRVFDGGAADVFWDSIQWNGFGTITVETRAGDSPVPDGSWTPFVATVGPVQQAHRYAQYRLTLVSEDGVTSPEAQDVHWVLRVAPTKLEFVSPPPVQDAGACSSPIMLQARDDAGDLGYIATTLPILLETSSAGGTFYSDPGCNDAITVADMGPTATLVVFYKDNIAGQSTLIASSPGLTDALIVATINPAPAVALNVSGFPSPTQSGDEGTFTVIARDAFGNVAVGYTGTVSFLSSDASATLPAAAVLTGGTASFTATLRSIGTHAIIATDGALTGSQSGIVVTGTPVASYSLVTGAGSACAATSATVTALDAMGNVVTMSNATLGVSSTDTRATVPAMISLMNGTATFDVTWRSTGAQTLSVTDGLLAASAPVTVSDNGAATTVSVTPAMASAQVGTNVSLAINTTTACDNPVAATVTLSSGATVTPSVNTDASGAATASVTSTTAGTFTITATAGSAMGTAQVTFTGAAAAKVKLAHTGEVDCAQQLTIDTVDANDNAAPTLAVITITAPQGTTIASTSLTAATGVGTRQVNGNTDAQGHATFSLTTPGAGTFNVAVNALGLAQADTTIEVEVTPTEGIPKVTFLNGATSVLVVAAGVSGAGVVYGARDSCNREVRLSRDLLSFTMDDAIELFESDAVDPATGYAFLTLFVRQCPEKRSFQVVPAYDGEALPPLTLNVTCEPPDPNMTEEEMGEAGAGAAIYACFTAAKSDNPPEDLGPLLASVRVVPKDKNGGKLGAGLQIEALGQNVETRTTDNGDGSYVVEIGSDDCKDPRPREVPITVGGVVISRRLVTFRCAPLDLEATTMTLDPPNGRAKVGATITATFGLRDRCALPAFDLPLSLERLDSNVAYAVIEAPVGATTDSNGVATFELTSDAPATLTMRVLSEEDTLGEAALVWGGVARVFGGVKACSGSPDASLLALVCVILLRARHVRRRARGRSR